MIPITNLLRFGEQGIYEEASETAKANWPLTVCLIILLGPLILTLFFALVNISSWLLWILISVIITVARLCYSIFVLVHVCADIMALSTMKTLYTVYRWTSNLLRGKSAISSMREKLAHARKYEEYLELAAQVDKDEGMMAWRSNEEDLPQAESLRNIIDKLDECLKQKDVQRLQFILLNGLIKRNHLGIDERVLHVRALSGTKFVVEDYVKKVVESLEFLCDCEELTREEKVVFFKKSRRALGLTALMLSGGGAIAMYHMGVIRALIRTGLYRYIRIISGTSGGSILTGLLAMCSEKELMEKVLVKEVSTDYKRTGQMKRDKIAWFPPVIDQIQHFANKGVLMENKEFQRTCMFYYGETTFQEAFEKTRKHVCISVAASTLGVKNPGGPKRLLLNHITSPNVLIRSAVAASCSLPGVMHPNYLLCKDESGQVVSFELIGVEYVDGSLQADLPFRRISAIFSASNFIVSQTNFHIVWTLHKAHSPAETSLYWRIFRFFDLDIRHRVISLSELGLLPKVFGQDLSGVFRQRYSGHITIVPKLRSSEMIGLKAFMNPTVEDMDHYIKNGERNTWAVLEHIKHNTCIERALTDCISKLRRQQFIFNNPTSIASKSLATSSSARHRTGSNGRLSTSASSRRNGGGAGTPPLAPLSVAEMTPQRKTYPPRSRPGTPNNMSPGGGMSLHRGDSNGSVNRFDDDGDILEESSHGGKKEGEEEEDDNTVESAASPYAYPSMNGGGGAVGSPIGWAHCVKELEVENQQLKGEIDRLGKALQELLANTERGLFQHESSYMDGGRAGEGGDDMMEVLSLTSHYSSASRIDRMSSSRGTSTTVLSQTHSPSTIDRGDTGERNL